MVDFPVEQRIGSLFQLQETETHFHAHFHVRYGENPKQRSYVKGSLEAQNIQIHAKNLLALEAIKERFNSQQRKWNILAHSAAYSIAILLLVFGVDKGLTGAISDRLLVAGGGLGLLSIGSYVQHVRYREKLYVIVDAQYRVARDFEQRLTDYEQKRPGVTFTYYEPYTCWLWDRHENLNEKERAEVYSAVTPLPATLLPPSPASINLQATEGVCALGGNSCVHNPECLRMQQPV